MAAVSEKGAPSTELASTFEVKKVALDKFELVASFAEGEERKERKVLLPPDAWAWSDFDLKVILKPCEEEMDSYPLAALPSLSIGTSE